jgi:hypothetical protein
MAEVIGMVASGGERFPASPGNRPVCDQLDRIVEMLRRACPPDTEITFSYDGRLQVHIDVRKREHVMYVEMVLPTLEPGLFDGVSLGGTPRHPFHHRVSALVHI